MSEIGIWAGIESMSADDGCDTHDEYVENEGVVDTPKYTEKSRSVAGFILGLGLLKV